MQVGNSLYVQLSNMKAVQIGNIMQVSIFWLCSDGRKSAKIYGLQKAADLSLGYLANG